MRRNIPGLSIILIASLLFNWSCTKIDTTTLGSDLIPAVDNVHTFADTLEISVSQGFFNDTTRLAYSELHPLGAITNDPSFGRTTSDLYLQLKPGFFPFFFGLRGDTINSNLNPKTGFDSAVLCLSLKSFYGDTLKPQTLEVYEINRNTTNFKDSSYRLDFLPDQGLGQLLGTVTVLPTDTKKYTYFKGSRKDSITNQIRIPLSSSFLQNTLLANLDTSSSSTGMYRSDSLFLTQFKGFAVKATGGQANGLFYVDVTDAATRLEVHYRKTNRGVLDTNFTTFSFSTGSGISLSAQATHLERDRSGYPVSSPSSDLVYIQATPGTYAILSVPGLSAYDNRIIHRAEVYMEQAQPLDAQHASFGAPIYMYMDLVDTPATSGKFKPIYYDLNTSANYNPDDTTFFYPSSGIDFAYFGGYIRTKNVGAVESNYYQFNVSRYVQHIVTNKLHNYSFRLYAPSRLYYNKYTLSFNNNLADGRVILGSGTHPNQKMYMRVVYSKL